MIYTRNGKGSGPRRLLTRALIIAVAVIVLGSVAAILFTRYGLGPFPFGISRRDTVLMSLWNEREFRAVLGEAEKTLAEHPVDGQALTFGGFAHLYIGIDEVDLNTRMDHIEQSIVLLRKAEHIPSAPLANERKYVLAKAYFHRGHPYLDLAVDYMDRSLESGYVGADSYSYLAMAYAGLEQWEASALNYERAIEESDTDVLHMKAAESWAEAGRHDVAEMHLRIAVEVSQDQFLSLVARNRLANALIQEEKLEEAEELLSDVLTVYPESADTLYYLGVVYDLTDRSIEARNMWRRAREIEPDHAEALKSLANGGG